MYKRQVRNGAVKDDAYYEKLAMEKGVPTKTARELDKLESQNKQLTDCLLYTS